MILSGSSAYKYTYTVLDSRASQSLARLKKMFWASSSKQFLSLPLAQIENW
jgi:hypothetical protein